MSFMQHIRRCNNFRPDEFVPLMVDNLLTGRVRPVFAAQLLAYPDVFQGDASRGVCLNSAITGFDERSAALAAVVEGLASQGIVQAPLGEAYPVTRGTREQAIFLVDREAASWFGFRAFGQHLNGYVRRGEELLMWVGKRSSDRRIFPGRLDQLVAGGLPHGISLADNLARECYEEAGIGAGLAARAQFAGSVTYFAQTEKGAKPDELFCYDLELPQEFEPRCTDGEVEAFFLMPVAEVMEIVRTSMDFKPNCSLVVLDFLLRHDLLDASHAEYASLKRGLKISLADSMSIAGQGTITPDSR
jgi:8-oxo-dGTP pyrophosphatase MutT (NUDIX family)